MCYLLVWFQIHLKSKVPWTKDSEKLLKIVEGSPDVDPTQDLITADTDAKIAKVPYLY